MTGCNDLLPESREIIQQRTTEIKALAKRTAQDIIEIGKRLIAVKALLPHGAFIDWLEAEFGWHRATANRFIQVAQQFGDKDLSQIATFDVSALYLLAAPSTPESVREEAVERASAGESITHEKAKAMRHEASTFLDGYIHPTPAPPTPKAAETEAAETEAAKTEYVKHGFVLRPADRDRLIDTLNRVKEHWQLQSHIQALMHIIDDWRQHHANL